MIKLDQTQLRKDLEQKIGQNKDLDSHQANLDELKNHSITIIRKSDLSDDFNCVMYALDFRLEDPTSPFGRYYANTKFLNFLIGKGYIKELDPQTDAINDYAIYYQDEDIQHIGLVSNDSFIESKWGAGHLFRHPFNQVPSSYGNLLRYFHSINSDIAIDYLIEFYSNFR